MHKRLCDNVSTSNGCKTVGLCSSASNSPKTEPNVGDEMTKEVVPFFVSLRDTCATPKNHICVVSTSTKLKHSNNASHNQFTDLHCCDNCICDDRN